MKKILLFSYMLLQSLSYSMAAHQSPHYVELANKAQNEIAKTLSKKYDMRVIGDYAALFERVNELGLRFNINGPLSKDELRYILIGCIKEYLCYINSDEEIRPYLKDYPFTSKNIDISIFVYGLEKKNFNLYYPEIAVASTYIGNLYYQTYGPENEFQYKTTEKETYEEALAIVKKQYPDFKDRCESRK